MKTLTCVLIDPRPPHCLAYERFWTNPRVVAFAHDAPSGLALVERHHPDAVMVSLATPSTPWLLTQRIVTRTQSAVLLATDRTFTLLADLAMASGAAGLIDASGPLPTIEEAARRVAQGERCFGPRWARRAEEILGGVDLVTSLLSEQDQRTLDAVALGLDAEAMAGLWRQPITQTQQHVRQLRERFEEGSTPEVFSQALAEGLFD